MKDSANSYEQLSWEHAVASYHRWLPFLDSDNEYVGDSVQKTIDRLVKQFPQLKD